MPNTPWKKKWTFYRSTSSIPWASIHSVDKLRNIDLNKLYWMLMLLIAANGNLPVFCLHIFFTFLHIYNAFTISHACFKELPLDVCQQKINHWSLQMIMTIQQKIWHFSNVSANSSSNYHEKRFLWKGIWHQCWYRQQARICWGSDSSSSMNNVWSHFITLKN